MIIQAKDGHQESVTPEKWQLMQDLGFGKGWSVISHGDSLTPRKTMPKELIDFKKVIKKNTKDGSERKPVIPGDKAV
jgi:hypothetical protein